METHPPIHDDGGGDDVRGRMMITEVRRVRRTKVGMMKVETLIRKKKKKKNYCCLM